MSVAVGAGRANTRPYCRAARQGSEGTRGMLPRLGRAGRLGERARAAQDAGATSAALWLAFLGRAVPEA